MAAPGEHVGQAADLRLDGGPQAAALIGEFHPFDEGTAGERQETADEDAEKIAEIIHRLFVAKLGAGGKKNELAA